MHLTDVSHPQYYAQKANVLKVLSQLNPKQQLLDNMVDVLNKTDKLLVHKTHNTDLILNQLLSN